MLETKLKAEITGDDQTKVALTSGIWTGLTDEAYLCTTSSYISSNWKLHTPVLAMVKLEEWHTADYLAQQLKFTTESWNTEQVSAVVHDGAAIVKDTGS